MENFPAAMRKILRSVDNIDKDIIPDLHATSESGSGSSSIVSGDAKSRTGHVKSVRFSNSSDHTPRHPILSTLEIVSKALDIVNRDSSTVHLTNSRSWRPKSRLYDPRLGAAPAMTIDLTGKSAGTTVGHRIYVASRAHAQKSHPYHHRQQFQLRDFGHVIRDRGNKREISSDFDTGDDHDFSQDEDDEGSDSDDSVADTDSGSDCVDDTDLAGAFGNTSRGDGLASSHSQKRPFFS